MNADFFRLCDDGLVGYFAVDSELQVTQVSPELARELFGTEASEMMGKSLRDPFNSPDGNSLHERLRGAMTRGRCQFRLSGIGRQQYEVHTWASRHGLFALVRACGTWVPEVGDPRWRLS